MDKINAVLNSYVTASSKKLRRSPDAGLNVYDQIKGIQSICFENACWAYTVGAAIAIKKDAAKQQMQQQQLRTSGFLYSGIRCRHP
ncbi:MAG: GGGtGRT protein [Waltera sp.]